jgi:hypothetical protein
VRNSRETIERLARDWDYVRRLDEKSPPIELSGFSPAEVRGILKSPENILKAIDKTQALSSDLLALHTKDLNEAQSSIDQFIRLMRKFSGDSDILESIFNLMHDSGLAPQCSFEHFASLLLDNSFDDRLQEINPYLQMRDLQKAEKILVFALVKLSRAGLLARCIASVSDLNKILVNSCRLAEATRNSAFNGILLKANAVAGLLSTRRSYVEAPKARKGHAVFDPRFLLFEFTANIVLRDTQIRLVNKFVQEIEKGESVCHQLIMGAGKTTIIAPLLALMLSSPNRLVVQVSHDMLFFARIAYPQDFQRIPDHLL